MGISIGNAVGKILCGMAGGGTDDKNILRIFAKYINVPKVKHHNAPTKMSDEMLLLVIIKRLRVNTKNHKRTPAPKIQKPECQKRRIM